ncbi:MAG: hypothetical protein RRY64_08420, partial [Oscillospiraceae bacterium]
MATQNKSAKRQQEDDALNRVLIWFGGTVLLELLVLLLNRFYINGTVQMMSVLNKVVPILGVVAAILAVVCGLQLKRYRSAKKVTPIPAAGMVFCAAAAICCFVTFLWNSTGLDLLYTLIPAICVLALVYYLYQREFFTIALLSAGTLLATWLLWKAGGVADTFTYLVCVLVAILAVAVAVITRMLQKNEGQFPVKSGKLRIFQKNATYLCIYITCIISALVLLAGLLLGATAAYAALFLTVAWIFIMAVFY